MDVAIIIGALVLVGVLAHLFGYDSREERGRHHPDSTRIWWQWQ